jgi:hypothetical protein
MADKYNSQLRGARFGECYQWGHWTRLRSARAGDSLLGSSPTFSDLLSRDEIDKNETSSVV